MAEYSLSKRQTKILELVTQNGYVATDHLVSEFDVTPQTIRRDMNELLRFGLISRFHGGAGLPQASLNRPYQDRLHSRVEAKSKIAELVADHIPDNSSLFLNNGTTIEIIAKELLKRNGLTVVTNNINIAKILSENSSFQVHIAGGQVRNVDGGIISLTVKEFIEQYHMDFGIVGINSIDDQGGLWEFDPLEVRISRATLESCEQSLLVADGHKFGRKAMCKMGHISEFDMFVTDTAPPSHMSSLLDKAAIEVLYKQV